MTANENEAHRAGEWVNRSLDKALRDGMYRAYSRFGSDMAAIREAALGNVQLEEMYAEGAVVSHKAVTVKSTAPRKRRQRK